MSLKSYNPYNGLLIAEYDEMNSQEVEEIIEESALAFKEWRFVPYETRKQLLNKVAELLEGNKGTLAKLITLEMGKPIKEAEAEVLKCAWVCRYYAEYAEKHLKEEEFLTDAHLSKVVYEPLGTILGIMPWNFPFWQVFRFLAPTIMAGNTALLKHSSNVQGCAKEIERLFDDAGFPKGVVSNLTIGSKAVAPVIENDSIKAVTLTGSEFAGKQVASLAGSCIKKTLLELGGSNAFVVLEDASIDEAVDEALMARMMNCGQSCIAAKRFILLSGIQEEFVEKLIGRIESLIVGDPMDIETQIGPLSSEDQAIEVEKQVEESIKLGAKLLTGGKRNGAFYMPTLLDHVVPGMPCFDQEVFGPVASVIHARTDEDAIELANSSRFGLGTTLFTNDFRKAERLVPLFEDGSVFINSLVKSDPRLPFGGTKKSGYGRELSVQGIREFVNVKTVFYAKKGN